MGQRLESVMERVCGVDRTLAWTLFAHVLVASVFLAVLLKPAVLPLMDLADHVELGMALKHLGDGTRIGDAFEFGVFPAPNTLFYALFVLFSSFLAPLVATKFVVGVYIVGVPFGVLYVLRSANKNVAWSLGAYPMLLSWPFQSGFIDYCISFVPLLFGLGLLLRTLRDGVSAARVAGLVALSSLAFFGHFQGGLFYALGAGCLLLVHAPGFTRTTWSSWLTVAVSTVAVVGVLFVLWYVQAKVVIASDHVEPPEWQDIDEKLRVAFANTYFVLTNKYDGIVFYSVLLSILAGLVLGRGNASGKSDGFLLFVFTSACVHALGPVTIGHYYHFDNRIPALAAFLVLIACAPSFNSTLRLRNVGTLLVFAAAAFAAIGAWMPSMRQFERWNEGFVETLSAAPDQTKLAYYAEEQGGSGFVLPPSQHFAGYHAALNLGIHSHSFANHPGRIVVQKRLGFDFETIDYARLASEHGLDGYEVLLQRGRRRLEANERFRLIARNGMWSVYRIAAVAR